MDTKDQDIDKELEPRKLWEITPEQIKVWMEGEKKRRKKLAKGWRPEGH
jgi:hypothetical protein